MLNHVFLNSHKGIFIKRSLLGSGFYKNNPGSMFNSYFHSDSLSNNINDHINLDDVLNYSSPSSANLFYKMCLLGGVPDETMINILIKCYCRSNNTELGFSVLGSCFKQGIVPHVSTYNALLNGFILEDRTHEAERLFRKFMNNQICEPNVVTYNTMIKGLCKIGNNFAAISLLRIMDGRGVCKPTIVTYNTIIDSLCNDVMIDDAFKLFREMVPDVFTYNSLIYALCQLGRWDEVCMMLEQMREDRITPIVKTFNILLNELGKQGKIQTAHGVLNFMIETGGKYPPDIMTYNSYIYAYCLRGAMTNAKTVFDSMVGVKPNINTYNILLDGYYQDWNVDEAIYMYNELTENSGKPRPNVVTKFIMAMVTHRFKRKQECLKADVYVHGIYLPAEHSHKSLFYIQCMRRLCHYNLENGLNLFHMMFGKQFMILIDVYHILIGGANRFDKFDVARRLFHDIYVKAGLTPYIKTYEFMIGGLCRVGLLKDAKRLFDIMVKSYSDRQIKLYEKIANDILQGYLKYKAIDNNGYMFAKEMERRGYRVNVPNALLMLDHDIARAEEPLLSFYKSGDDEYPYFPNTCTHHLPELFNAEDTESYFPDIDEYYHSDTSDL